MAGMFFYFVNYLFWIIYTPEEFWKIISKPDVVEVFEGDDGTASIKIGGGLEDQPPQIKWIKGKILKP